MIITKHWIVHLLHFPYVQYRLWFTCFTIVPRQFHHFLSLFYSVLLHRFDCSTMIFSFGVYVHNSSMDLYSILYAYTKRAGQQLVFFVFLSTVFGALVDVIAYLTPLVIVVIGAQHVMRISLFSTFLGGSFQI